MFVDVLLPLPFSNTFTYALPQGAECEVGEGCRVVVPFGAKKYYTALVVRVHDERPADCEVKGVLEVLDRRPSVLRSQFNFWSWIADYYICTLGEVYRAAMPSGMKLESESVVVYNEDFIADSRLPEREQRLLDILSGGDSQCSLSRLERESGIRHLMPVVKSLLDKGAILVKEELRRAYRPRTEARVRLAEAYRSEMAFNALMDSFRRAPKQQELLLRYLELSGADGSGGTVKEVARKSLLKGSGLAAFNALLHKGVFEQYEAETGRLSFKGTTDISLNTLSEAQQKAYDGVKQAFQQKNVCLLHGVTSSGKTEIYIHLIADAIGQGKQVLYLLPEIALTAQLAERLRRVFGDRLGVYHSKFPDAERVEIWQKQLSDKPYDVLLGVRSSIFLPFRNLGLVIVDEEHENSYKQQDPAPRYHARNAAIVLASGFSAKTLLGSATPSIESFHNATRGKYGLVTLSVRYLGLQLPHIELVDIGELSRKKRMVRQLSPLLRDKMREALEAKRQVILFQNRRGYAPRIECHVCGYVPRCNNCDVSLTYHKYPRQLTCHYCGNVYPIPAVCPACESDDLRDRGFGTEKVEDSVHELFPEARVARLDLDTARTRAGYERIIDDFEQGRTDILIGTQMVSKGLDFSNVSVVGILNADSLLSHPDFRADERAYQLMAQVAGRAGRKSEQAIVILQTRQPESALISQVLTGDYSSMYRTQVDERIAFRYPPFCRLVYVYVKHRKENVVDEATAFLLQQLRPALGSRVFGSIRPPVSRVQALFIRKIVLKFNLDDSLSAVRDYLLKVCRFVNADQRFRSVNIYFDVDPM